MHFDHTEYVIFDVETTGLSPLKGDRIIEIGALKVKGSKVIDSFETFVNPLRKLSEEAMRVNNITEEMVADAPTSEEVMPKMLDFIGGACVVGHNVKFDLDFLVFELSQIGRKLRDETPAIDTLKMAKELKPHLTSYKLANLAVILGVPIEETHRALADVKLTFHIMRRLLDIATSQKIEKFVTLVEKFGVQKPVYKIKSISQETLF